MKSILFLLFIFLSTLTFAKPIVVVSILPQKTFVQKIAKDMVDVTLMVAPGSSPHSYEPKASQMVALSQADIYFSVGVEFEHAWLQKFQSQNKNLKFVDMAQGITKIEMQEHHHEGKHSDEHDTKDPHIWTSPKNVAIMAQTIYDSLVKLDPNNAQHYKANFNSFIQEIKRTDAKIQTTLQSVQPKAKFMVFHPSWGYFADAYNLSQFAVEIEGKSPKPREMIQVIKEAKKEHVRVIFTQPEFSDKSAKIIAKEVGVKVVKISPLNPKWSQNLIHMAEEIARKP